MSIARATSAVVALAAACTFAVTTGNATATSRARETRHRVAHMLVYAQEWSLWPSRTSLPSGKVSVQLWNRGQDAHDLRIRRVARDGRMYGPAQGAPVTPSGDISQAAWTLAPGVYQLYCSMPGHFARGMHVLLRVR